MEKRLNRILVANRGEIAHRIMRTLHLKGREVVVVYSDADANAGYLEDADVAVNLPGNTPAETYLNIPLLIEIAKTHEVDAIHPGYGFLSENAEFAKACAKAGITFIGPDADTIAQLGSKIKAKELARSARVPVVPGYDGADQRNETLIAEGVRIGFPLLVKASAGGGGKGMRVVYEADKLPQALEMARSEAQKAFGDGSLLLEKYFTSVKHIEVQIFGDHHGNQVHFFERECSVQRRHQKIVEESPSPSLTAQQRESICNAALNLAKAINYVNAGTVEFIFDGQDFYFLEVNTRLQVEHPVTEMVTGLDLVELQLLVAEGEKLSDLIPDNLKQTGHAVECRIYAEDPANNYMPSIGAIVEINDPVDILTPPIGVQYRCDNALLDGASEVSPYYDPMLAKVIVVAPTRERALVEMSKLLSQTSYIGIRTNVAQLNAIMKHPAFVNASFDTHFADKYAVELNFQPPPKPELLAVAVHNRVKNWSTYRNPIPCWYSVGMAPITHHVDLGNTHYTPTASVVAQKVMVEINGLTYEVETTGFNDFTVNRVPLKAYMKNVNNVTYIVQNEHIYDFKFEPLLSYADAEMSKGGCTAPMPGEVVRILVKPGQEIKVGDAMLVISAMKMENTIESPKAGVIKSVLVVEKEQVKADQVLVEFEDGE